MIRDINIWRGLILRLQFFLLSIEFSTWAGCGPWTRGWKAGGSRPCQCSWPPAPGPGSRGPGGGTRWRGRRWPGPGGGSGHLSRDNELTSVWQLSESDTHASRWYVMKHWTAGRPQTTTDDENLEQTPNMITRVLNTQMLPFHTLIKMFSGKARVCS